MRSFSLFVIVLCICSSALANDTSDLVKNQLNSIGPEQFRTAAKSRAVQGATTFRLLSGSGAQDGKEVLISEENKVVALLKLPNPSYHGERFVYDGKARVNVVYISPGKYSTLGSFVEVHQEILKDGLFGGTLLTGWALANIDRNNPKLRDQGLKKVNGRELRRVQYEPAKRSDLEIFLYFDPQTMRHVSTTYSLTISPKMGATELENAKQDYTRYFLEERFDDFKEVDGLHLPHKWTIQFTSEVPADPNHPTLGRSLTSVSEFETTITSIQHNIALDPKNFEVK